MSQPYDLVTLDVATAAVSTSLPASALAGLPGAISAASRAIRRYLARDIVLTTYDECYDGNGYSTLILRQYPLVCPLARLATGPTTVLTVANTDRATNQRAGAALTTTGDADAGLTVTGITLTRTTSGVVLTDALTLFSDYPTVQAVADHVNTLGNGWSATVAAGYGLWGTAELRAIQGSSNALTSGGAAFRVHTTDLSNFTVNERSGVVTLGSGYYSYDPGFAAMGFGINSVFLVGRQNVRVQYTAGYATIPEDLQQACLVTVQDWLTRLATNNQFKSETADGWSYTLPDKLYGLSADALSILKSGGWRSYRRY